jgi:hypothetical protein
MINVRDIIKRVAIRIKFLAILYQNINRFQDKPDFTDFVCEIGVVHDKFLFSSKIRDYDAHVFSFLKYSETFRKNYFKLV